MGLVLVCGVTANAEITKVETSKQVSTPFYFTYSTNVSSGLLTFTNLFEHPWRFGSIIFDMPDTYTNEFKCELISVTESLAYQSGQIATNVFGDIVTNYVYTLTNTAYAYHTNILVSAPTTGKTETVFAVNMDGDRKIPDYTYVLGGDIVRFTWTYGSNTIPLTWQGLR